MLRREETTTLTETKTITAYATPSKFNGYLTEGGRHTVKAIHTQTLWIASTRTDIINHPQSVGIKNYCPILTGWTILIITFWLVFWTSSASAESLPHFVTQSRACSKASDTSANFPSAGAIGKAIATAASLGSSNWRNGTEVSSMAVGITRVHPTAGSTRVRPSVIREQDVTSQGPVITTTLLLNETTIVITTMASRAVATSPPASSGANRIPSRTMRLAIAVVILQCLLWLPIASAAATLPRTVPSPVTRIGTRPTTWSKLSGSTTHSFTSAIRPVLDARVPSPTTTKIMSWRCGTDFLATTDSASLPAPWKCGNDESTIYPRSVNLDSTIYSLSLQATSSTSMNAFVVPAEALGGISTYMVAETFSLAINQTTAYNTVTRARVSTDAAAASIIASSLSAWKAEKSRLAEELSSAAELSKCKQKGWKKHKGLPAHPVRSGAGRTVPVALKMVGIAWVFFWLVGTAQAATATASWISTPATMTAGTDTSTSDAAVAYTSMITSPSGPEFAAQEYTYMTASTTRTVVLDGPRFRKCRPPKDCGWNTTLPWQSETTPTWVADGVDVAMTTTTQTTETIRATAEVEASPGENAGGKVVRVAAGLVGCLSLGVVLLTGGHVM